MTKRPLSRDQADTLVTLNSGDYLFRGRDGIWYWAKQPLFAAPPPVITVKSLIARRLCSIKGTEGNETVRLTYRGHLEARKILDARQATREYLLRVTEELAR